MSNLERVATRIVGGLAIGAACALFSHSRDERKFEPSLVDHVKALDAKWTEDGKELATQIENAKHDAEKIVKEKSSPQ